MNYVKLEKKYLAENYRCYLSHHSPLPIINYLLLNVWRKQFRICHAISSVSLLKLNLLDWFIYFDTSHCWDCKLHQTSVEFPTDDICVHPPQCTTSQQVIDYYTRGSPGAEYFSDILILHICALGERCGWYAFTHFQNWLVTNGVYVCVCICSVSGNQLLARNVALKIVELVQTHKRFLFDLIVIGSILMKMWTEQQKTHELFHSHYNWRIKYMVNPQKNL